MAPAAKIDRINTFLWMEDGTIFSGGADIAGDTIGTIRTTAPVQITLFGIAAIPEPGTLALLSAGALALVPTIVRRLRKTA